MIDLLLPVLLALAVACCRTGRAMTWLACLLLAPLSHAGEVSQLRVDVARQEGEPLGKYLSWRQDAAPMTVREVAGRLQGDDWQRPDQDVPGFGIAEGVFWFYLPLHLPESETRWIVELQYAVIKRVDAYLLRDGHIIETFSGDRNNAEASVRNRNPLVFLQHHSGDVDLLLRVESQGSLQMPLSVWREPIFLAYQENSVLAFGLFFGILLAMMVYNGFIAMSGAGHGYLLYAGMVASVTVFLTAMQGFGERFFWGDSAFWYEHILPLSIYLAMFFAISFCDIFLQLKKHADTLRRGYLWLRNIAAVGALLAFWMPVNMMVHAGALLVFLVACYTSLLLVRHYDSVDRAVQFFCIGWIVFMAGVLLISANKLNIIPRNFFTENLMLMGSVIEMLMLSLALAERIHQERTQKELAQGQAMLLARRERDADAEALQHESVARAAQETSLNLQREANALLEKKVQERSEALAQINRDLENLTLQDPLTGVRNRRFLNERLPQEYSRACRSGDWLSVLMVDIDYFKRINDEFGHLAGDDCLKAVALHLERYISGPGAVVTRYGGEEFCILLPCQDQTMAMQLAEQLCREASAKQWSIRGHDLRVTLSIGVATAVPGRDGRHESLLDAADRALYAAKASGRNRVCAAAPAEGAA